MSNGSTFVSTHCWANNVCQFDLSLSCNQNSSHYSLTPKIRVKVSRTGYEFFLDRRNENRMFEIEAQKFAPNTHFNFHEKIPGFQAETTDFQPDFLFSFLNEMHGSWVDSLIQKGLAGYNRNKVFRMLTRFLPGGGGVEFGLSSWLRPISIASLTIAFIGRSTQHHQGRFNPTLPCQKSLCGCIYVWQAKSTIEPEINVYLSPVNERPTDCYLDRSSLLVITIK